MPDLILSYLFVSVPAKFRRVDDDSDSEESDDEQDLKTGSGAESSNDEEEKANDCQSDESDLDNDRDGDLISLRPDKDEVCSPVFSPLWHLSVLFIITQFSQLSCIFRVIIALSD